MAADRRCLTTPRRTAYADARSVPALRAGRLSGARRTAIRRTVARRCPSAHPARTAREDPGERGGDEPHQPEEKETDGVDVQPRAPPGRRLTAREGERID